MEQFDDTCKALTTFRMAAAAQVAATECGDYKKGNNAFDRIIQILREDIHSLTTKATLEQWEQDTLIYPF